ncbi:hypothetical protein [Diaminobutyricimonas aerilata]|nr:hypothetical protein [Diaminobutyricimonas aerilata]
MGQVVVRPFAALAVVGALAAALAACTPTGEGAEPDPTSTPRPSASGSASATPEPTPTEDPIVGEPVGVDCDQLVTPDVMYAYNPNFALLPEPTIDEGSDAAIAQEQKGLVCQWQNLTSNELLTVAVAKLPDEALTLQKNRAFGESTMVPTYGVEGYFTVADGVGEADAFDRDYWVSTRSSFYLEPGDAIDIVAASLAALP